MPAPRHKSPIFLEKLFLIAHLSIIFGDKMKTIQLLAIISVVLPFVYGDIVINEVYYDPAGTDTGLEFVELYNPTDEDIGLEGYVLESGNGAGPDDWTLEWTGDSEVLYSKGHFLIGESDVSPEPAFVTALDLQNGPDAVRLRKNETIIDLVGYGDHDYEEYYEGTPAPDIAEGLSLQRIGNDTDNNLLDFSPATPNPENGAPPDNLITIHINVIEPSLDSVYTYVDDEDPTRDGIQIFPSPGNTRTVDVIVELSDSSLANDSQVNMTVNGDTFQLNLTDKNETWQEFHGAFPMPFSYPDGNYTIDIVAASGYKHGNDEIVFEYMAMAALMIDTTEVVIDAEPDSFVECIGDTDTSTKDRATVRNIGNVDVEVGVQGTPLSSGNRTINPENIEVALGTDFNQSLILSGDVQYFSDSFSSDSVSELSYKMWIPVETEPSTYTGALQVTVRPLE